MWFSEIILKCEQFNKLFLPFANVLKMFMVIVYFQDSELLILIRIL